MVARRALPDPLARRAVHLAGRPQHDHQAVDRADRRHDDGRLVPVDLGRAICRRHGRAGRERRDGRRPGHQPQVSLDTYTAMFTTIAWIAIGIGRRPVPAVAGRSRNGCTVSNKMRWRAALAAALLPVGLRGSSPPSPSRRRRSAINEDPYPSTYVRYPGVLTVIRHATVFDGEGRRIDDGTVVFADGVDPGGRRARTRRARPARSRSTAPASG